jgi:phage shock protein PspC (stress-responsive transcriptional regulator)
MNKTLHRSASDRVFFGVCGGIAAYFDVDSVVIRLLMVIFGLTGAGLLFYLIAAILMKDEFSFSAVSQRGGPTPGAEDAETYRAGGFDEPPADGAVQNRGRASGSGSGKIVFGLILILIGGLYIIHQFIPVFYWINGGVLFAVLLVILGVYFIARR